VDHDRSSCRLFPVRFESDNLPHVPTCPERDDLGVSLMAKGKLPKRVAEVVWLPLRPRAHTEPKIGLSVRSTDWEPFHLEDAVQEA
jgi:hypothetical protein